MKAVSGNGATDVELLILPGPACRQLLDHDLGNFTENELARMEEQLQIASLPDGILIPPEQMTRVIDVVNSGSVSERPGISGASAIRGRLVLRSKQNLKRESYCIIGLAWNALGSLPRRL